MSAPTPAPAASPAAAGAPTPTPTSSSEEAATPAATTTASAAAGPTATPEAAAPARAGAARPRRRASDATRWHLDAAEEPEAEGWLLTYLDLITLMLVMLVVLLAFGRSRSVAEMPSDGVAAAPVEEATPAVPAAGAGGDPWEGLPRDHFGDDVELMVSAETIRFRISDAILFASGEAELSNRGVRVLERLLPTLAAAPHQLVVEGHTDDQPIGTTRFPSNWELSTARAARVVRYLERRGIDAGRLRATGYAATRPIADNGDPQQRGRNRRVELILQRGG